MERAGLGGGCVRLGRISHVDERYDRRRFRRCRVERARRHGWPRRHWESHRRPGNFRHAGHLRSAAAFTSTVARSTYSTARLPSTSRTAVARAAASSSPRGTVTAVSTLFGSNGPVDYSGDIDATDSLFQTAPTGTLSGSGNIVGSDPLLDASGLQNQWRAHPDRSRYRPPARP